MRDKKATNQRPPTHRRAGTRESEDASLARAESLLTVRQVARMLCVSPPTVYSMIRRGELRALYVRRMVRLRLEDVTMYMRLHQEWVLKQRRKQVRAMAK